jgi:hypothetical protein
MHPASEAVSCIPRGLGQPVRSTDVKLVRVVTVRDVGVVVTTGVDDHRSAVVVEKLRKSEALGLELLLRSAVFHDQQCGEVARVQAVDVGGGV